MKLKTLEMMNNYLWIYNDNDTLDTLRIYHNIDKDEYRPIKPKNSKKCGYKGKKIQSYRTDSF